MSTILQLASFEITGAPGYGFAVEGGNLPQMLILLVLDRHTLRLRESARP